MFRTEAEALSAICPQTLGTAHPGYCLGSGCMWWREDEEPREVVGDGPPVGDGWRLVRTTGDGGLVTKKTAWVRDVGYCGLVGRPITRR
jgi:hypothetical protein